MIIFLQQPSSAIFLPRLFLLQEAEGWEGAEGKDGEGECGGGWQNDWWKSH